MTQYGALLDAAPGVPVLVGGDRAPAAQVDPAVWRGRRICFGSIDSRRGRLCVGSTILRIWRLGIQSVVRDRRLPWQSRMPRRMLDQQLAFVNDRIGI